VPARYSLPTALWKTGAKLLGDSAAVTHARPPATPRSHPEMRAKELAYENRLAGPGENGLKESRPGPHSLAAFDLTTEAYDNNGISNPNDGRLNPLLFLLIHEGEFTALLPKEKTE
jgi:hypothetical protein